MTENLLYLCPEDPDYVPAQVENLMTKLQNEGFLGEGFTYQGEQHYRPGTEFLSQITFLGCSPHIATDEAEATEGFTHIALEGPLDNSTFISGDNIKPPRCPHCGQRVENWQEQAIAAHIVCSSCQQELQPQQLRWRKCAGYGRFFIKVWGVFESEAVPSPGFLVLLEKLSGCRWQHFYVRYQG